MKTRTIISAIIGLTLWLGLSPAQETPPAVAAQAEAPVAEHPFVNTGFYPSWSKMTAEVARADVQYAIALARQRHAAICAIEPGQETWENVFVAMDEADKELDFAQNYIINRCQVARTQDMQELQEELLSTIAAFGLEMTYNEALWQVIKRAAAQPWVQELPPERQRYIEHLVSAFRDSGADLPADKKAHLKALLEEFIKLQLQFDKNGEASAYIWEMEIKSREKLAGVPAQWLKENASGRLWNKRWVITMADAKMIMDTCSVASTRKACWDGWNTFGKSGNFNNEPVVARVMEIRQDIAETIGFTCFADMMCKSRMVTTGTQALAFVDDMMERLLPVFRQEQQEVLDFAAECTGKKKDKLAPWDHSYYSAQLAKKHSDFDVELMRPYLREEKVRQGMFDLACRLYDISITELPTAFIANGETCPEGAVEVWAEGVKAFKVTDNKTGAHLGSFYYDIYSRYNKQGGAWTQPLRPGMGGEPHLASLLCNFAPPGKAGYTLLDIEDVHTLFHEFGHVLHAMFHQIELRFFSMLNVKPDFSELPSQFFESFAEEPEVISTFAFHHETGEPIPAELLEQFRQHRDFHPATDGMERLVLSKLDLELHMHYKEKFAGKPLDDATAEIVAPWSPPFTQFGSSPILYFAHSVSKGYAAAYFSYSWTEVLAADVFAEFKRNGLINPDLAERFRRTILQPGSSKPADAMYRDFMGRDPDPSARLEKYGIK